MRIVKPQWIQLDGGGPIFSIDLDAAGDRIATGGQGDGCGLVLLWHLEPVLNPVSKRPRELCRLTSHASCVNAVRFAPRDSGGGGGNKKWLASGAVDGLVMLWCHMGGGDDSSNPLFGGGVEHWRCAATLRGHEGDVLDLQWSPLGDRLASASVDNTVAVWQVWPVGQHRRLATLRGHSGLVKGVAWDPVGRYLASQSDDGSLRVWRTDTWRLEARVTAPFEAAPQSTPFLRPSWSPDGGFILAANAVNSGFPTAPLIFRDNWASNMDLVGHIKAVTCCAVCPLLLLRRPRSNSRVRNGAPAADGDAAKEVAEDAADEEVHAACMALGSKDRSVSIWLTSMRRPVLALHDLFAGSICDLVWSADGCILAAASHDGSVALLQFEPGELGKPLGLQELARLHRQRYGNTALLNGAAGCDRLLPVSDPHLLRLQQAVAVAKAPTAASTPLQPPPPPPSGPAEQVESRGKDGKRRITPKFLGHLYLPEQQQQQPPEATVPTESTAAPKTSPEPPILDGPVQLPPPPPPPQPSQQPVAPPPVHSSPSVSPTKQQQQLNKKRGRPPRLVSMSSMEQQNFSGDLGQAPESAEQPAAKQSKLQQKHRRQDQGQQRKQLKSQQPRSRISSSSSSSEASAASSGSSTADLSADSDQAVDVGSAHRRSQAAFLPCRLTFDGEAAHGVAFATAPLTNGRLARVERRRSGASCALACYSLSLCLGDTPLWTIPLSRPITCLAAGGRAIAVGDAGGRLHLFAHDGARLSPPLLLPGDVAGSPAALAASVDGRIAAVTQSGQLIVWQLLNPSASSAAVRRLIQEPVPRLSASPLRVASLSLHSGDASALLACSSGHAVCYCAAHGAWLDILDPEDPGAAIWFRSHARAAVGPGGGVLQLLQSAAAAAAAAVASSVTAKAASNQNLSAASAAVAVAAFLERQVAAARALESVSELRHWLGLYARHLAVNGLESRLRALCEDLLLGCGAALPSAPQEQQQQQLLGLSKRSLLCDLVLPAFALNLGLQRLFQEVRQQLDLFGDDSSAACASHPLLQ